VIQHAVITFLAGLTGGAVFGWALAKIEGWRRARFQAEFEEWRRAR
jgi:hypothetical protein